MSMPMFMNYLQKTFRLLLVKPLTGMNNSGLAVSKILAAYGVKDPAKQLIVVFDDMNTLQGSIAVQSEHGRAD